MSVLEEIHLSDPTRGPSYCGEPVTVIEVAGDTRPVCQKCHRGAMKTMRAGWCPCAMGRPQDCKPEEWPRSARHGLSDSYRKRSAAVEGVLGLHKPKVEQVITGDCASEECDHEESIDCPLSPFTYCACCYALADQVDSYFTEGGINLVAWPCKTVKAVTSALEEVMSVPD